MLVGAYRLIRQLGETYAASLPGILYYRSAEEDLRSQPEKPSGKTDVGIYERILKNEQERDLTIAAAFAQGTECVLIEQWHVGNLARASIQAPSTVASYRQAMAESLRRFEGANISAFYVATKLHKWVSLENKELKGRELDVLASILREMNIKVETIDGDALPPNVQQRLAYLLGRVLGAQEAQRRRRVRKEDSLP
jgi:hypothetical protein